MELNCQSCNFSTLLKTNFIRHLKTKKHIKNISIYEGKLPTIAQKDGNEHKMSTNEHKMSTNEHKLFACDYCGIIFSSKPNMRRHELHFCKIVKTEKAKTNEMKLVIEEYKKEANSKLELIIEDYKKETDEHKKERVELHDHIKSLLQNHKNTTNNINIGNQTINTIILNNYGKEDLSYITDEFKSKLLEGPYGMIQKMIEVIHFNKDKPENSNIILPNKKEKMLKIYRNDTWVYKDEVEAIDDLIDAKYFMLDNHFVRVSQLENSPLKLDFLHEVKYKRFQYLFDRKNVDIHDSIRKDCKMILLNNR